MPTKKDEVKLSDLVKLLEELDKKVVALEKEVKDLKKVPAPSTGDDGELKRVAGLVDRIVQVIQSPVERITDRNLKL